MQSLALKQNCLGLPETIRWDDGQLYFLDQTRLPLEVVEERQETIEQVADSIRKLKVRGAPAIGIAGAYGMLIGLRGKIRLPPAEFIAEASRAAEFLGATRPTAVNLKWALQRMLKRAQPCVDRASEGIFSVLEAEACAIHEEDRQLCKKIGEHGASLIKPHAGILTHCNAGSLCASELGTALAPLYVAHRAGCPFKVFAGETRPLLQGARLTSWELRHAGIDVSLMTDSMAAYVMAQKWVDLVIVGADRVAANGDVANKIGTFGLAVLAKHFDIPFYVACPYSTIDFDLSDGKKIVIEQRSEEEVTSFGLRRTAPEGVPALNPAFDVTPHELVTAFITEKALIRGPFSKTLSDHYSRG